MRDFKRTHSCPATGKTSASAACPGWQIDHVVPLKCGGADAPANMQWLTVHDHALKTKREARLCRPSKTVESHVSHQANL
jgi:5-methylcytosine-specific restriction endonuclease McrA